MTVSALIGFAVGILFYHFIVSPMGGDSPARIERSAGPVPAAPANGVQQYTSAGVTDENPLASGPGVSPIDQPTSVTNTEEIDNSPEDVDTAYEALLAKAQRDNSALFEIFKDFESQQIDYEWSQNYEQQIREFVSLHELSYSAAINTLICKSSICELSVTIYEPEQWRSLIGDLWGQPWWNFSLGEHESVNNDEKQEVYSYYLFKEVYVY